MTGSLAGFFWDPPRNLKIVSKVDPRAIGNREQVENLLTAVDKAGSNGPKFVAFFGCMYYAMMRPGEVAHSLEMLYNVYSKVLDGFEKRWQELMDKVLEDEDDPVDDE